MHRQTSAAISEVNINMNINKMLYLNPAFEDLKCVTKSNAFESRVSSLLPMSLLLPLSSVSLYPQSVLVSSSIAFPFFFLPQLLIPFYSPVLLLFFTFSFLTFPFLPPSSPLPCVSFSSSPPSFPPSFLILSSQLFRPPPSSVSLHLSFFFFVLIPPFPPPSFPFILLPLFFFLFPLFLFSR